MKYRGTLLAVTDLARSRAFYCDLLGLAVVGDFGANVQLEGGVFLQTLPTWQEFIGGRPVQLQNNAAELYFEENDLDGLSLRLDAWGVSYVHPLIEHRWGQRAVRFFDPDGHIIEAAESLKTVMERFREDGMSAPQIAARMDVPEEYVDCCLGGL